VIARRRPWWFSLVVGVAASLTGAYLIAEPFRSLNVLATLVAVGLLLSAAGELAHAHESRRPWLAWLVALAWLAGGLLALAWPGITVVALALSAGLGLLVGGLLKLRLAMLEQGEERLLAGVGALAAVVVGALAISWPAVTVLALAVMFGIRTFLFGCAQLAIALRPLRTPQRVVVQGGRVLAARNPARPRPLRWTAAVAALAVALAGAVASVALNQRSAPRPGPFYAIPARLPRGGPGTLIRYELIPHFYLGAKTYRVLYVSTGFDGRPTAVSGLVIVPEGAAPRGGRKVIAFTHGTVGVASNCAPSLQGTNPGQIIEGLGGFLAAGYVVAATDYQGLGTTGPSPYLIGRVEAMDALDSVRAAHRLKPAHAGVEYAIWGHSQGGQAALFTAQLAPSYAPGLRLVGVAAGAPVPDLVNLFKLNIKTTPGKVLIAMALYSWEQLFGAAKLERIVTPVAQAAVAQIARRCLYGSEYLASIPSALLLNFTFLHSPPWESEPWRTIAAENTPGQAPIYVPVLVTQGGADKIVPPHITAGLVKRLCAHGLRVQERVYPSVGHLEAGIVAAPDVARWIGERFAGDPPPSSCPGTAAAG
jgi:uncharacterized membrane protein HdeD (DUF308 family)/pimeloyl-ACP methyl ester carboxylesterase